MTSNPHALPYRMFPHGTDWMESAACNEGNRSVLEYSVMPAAKELCQSCPVTSTCLDHLLSWPEQVGYGGGMTESERVKEMGAREWAERKRRQKAEGRMKAKQQMVATAAAL